MLCSAPEQLLEEAESIAKEIWRRRLRTPRGNVAWRGPSGYGTDLTPLRVAQLGPDLYGGTTGIALFFAALAHVKGGGDFRAESLAAVAPLRGKLLELSTDPERASGLRIPLGALIGLGSFIYGLLKVGEFLDEPDLIREAHAATALITSERISENIQGQIQTGCAGAILALLALQKKEPGPNCVGKTPLDLATECGQHLLATRISFEGRPRAWALSPGKPPLAGFSYGASGICYALLRLFEATGSQDLWDSAQEGLAFVRDLYCPERGSWRDLRVMFQARYRPSRGTWRDWWASGSMEDLKLNGEDDRILKDRFLDIWCHGASGIALGQMAALPINDHPEIRQEIGRSLEHAKTCAQERSPLVEADDLCCGHMGRIEFLLGAYRMLGNEGALEAAHVLMERVRQRACSKGRYDLSAARGTDAFAPSLFQGSAGVGYTLLRLAEPEALPCLLLLQ